MDEIEREGWRQRAQQDARKLAELTKERDEARKERDALEIVMAERDEAVTRRDELVRELQSAQGLKDWAREERDTARKERNTARSERDSLKAFEVHATERDEASAALEREKASSEWWKLQCNRARYVAYLEPLGEEDRLKDMGESSEPEGATELKEHDPESLDLDILNEPRDAREQDEQTAREEREAKSGPLGTPEQAAKYWQRECNKARIERDTGLETLKDTDLEKVHTLTSRVIDAIDRRTKCQGIDPEQVDIRGYFVSGDLQWMVSTMGWSATAPASLEQAFDNLIHLILEGEKCKV